MLITHIGLIGIRAMFAITGALIMIAVFMLFTYRKLLVRIAMYWNITGLILIVLGLLPIWDTWKQFYDGVFFWPFLVIFFVITIGLLYVSIHMSTDIIKTRELAMHISLTNRENEELNQKMQYFRDMNAEKTKGSMMKELCENK